MGILDILFHNTGNRPRTLLPADQTTPDGFRGALEHDPDLCTGCGTCAYVCSPGAIQLEPQPSGVAWEYHTGRCTFCARCAEYCPTKAIHLEFSAPLTASATVAAAAGNRQPDTMVTHHMVDYRPCERCGQPFIPLPGPVVARILGREADADYAALMGMCEKCRSRVTSQRFKDSLTGLYHPNRR